EPDQPTAWIGLADLDAARFSADDVVQLQRALRLPEADLHARVCFGFALTRALEDQGDFGEAFRALRKANGLMQRQLGWNAMKATARTEVMRQLFAQRLPSAPDARLGEEVIFVVGMPQAGSLLTGQILATHPQVAMSDGSSELEQLIDAESTRRQQPLQEWMAAATPSDWQRL